MPNSITITVPYDKKRKPELQQFLQALQMVCSSDTNYGTTAQRPTEDLWIGQSYLDTTLQSIVTWNGSAWIVSTGGAPVGGNYQEDVYANGTIVLANSTMNFNNTSTINVRATANGTTQSNVAFNANLASTGTYSNGTLVVANVANINFTNSNSPSFIVTSNGNQTTVSAQSEVVLAVSMSDLSSNLTTGQNKSYIRSSKTWTLTNVMASLQNASTSGNVAVQIRDNGSNVLTTIITINANANTSIGASQAPVINASMTTIAFNDLLQFDIVQAGTGAVGLVVYLIGNN